MHGAGAGEGLFWAAASNCNRDAAVDKRIRGTWRSDGTAPTPSATGGRDKRARQRAAAAAGLLGWVEGKVAVRLEAEAGGWRLEAGDMGSAISGPWLSTQRSAAGVMWVGVGVGVKSKRASKHTYMHMSISMLRVPCTASCHGALSR
jgi:hypothetical protein